VTITQRYLQSLQITDLRTVHDRLSPLSQEHRRSRRDAVEHRSRLNTHSSTFPAPLRPSLDTGRPPD
jgi:hypothetical protein